MMRNDLISRSAVISLIDELGYVNCRNSKDFEANSRVDKIRQGVVELPTAYDVDKVVEQVEDYLFERYCVEGDCKIDEIIKAGGVSDNN